MKKTIKTQYEELVQEVKKYVSALRAMKAETACSFPAYGKPGDDNSATKSQPNVVFVKDLITQVNTANKLGYNTYLTTSDGELFINFVEKTPPVPLSLRPENLP
jgi:hypothetical protein